MLAIDLVKLALIELEYLTADILHHKTSTADPSERAVLDMHLPKIRAAKAAVEFAIEVWPEEAQITLMKTRRRIVHSSTRAREVHERSRADDRSAAARILAMRGRDSVSHPAFIGEPHMRSTVDDDQVRPINEPDRGEPSGQEFFEPVSSVPAQDLRQHVASRGVESPDLHFGIPQ